MTPEDAREISLICQAVPGMTPRRVWSELEAWEVDVLLAGLTDHADPDAGVWPGVRAGARVAAPADPLGAVPNDLRGL